MPLILDNRIDRARHEDALTSGACERDIIEQTLNESVKSRGHRLASFATAVLWRKWRYTSPSRLNVPGVERKALQRFSGKKEAVVDAAAVDVVDADDGGGGATARSKVLARWSRFPVKRKV